MIESLTIQLLVALACSVFFTVSVCREGGEGGGWRIAGALATNSHSTRRSLSLLTSPPLPKVLFREIKPFFEPDSDWLSYCCGWQIILCVCALLLTHVDDSTSMGKAVRGGGGVRIARSVNLTPPPQPPPFRAQSYPLSCCSVLMR